MQCFVGKTNTYLCMIFGTGQDFVWKDYGGSVFRKVDINLGSTTHHLCEALGSVMAWITSRTPLDSHAEVLASRYHTRGL